MMEGACACVQHMIPHYHTLLFIYIYIYIYICLYYIGENGLHTRLPLYTQYTTRSTASNPI